MTSPSNTAWARETAAKLWTDYETDFIAQPAELIDEIAKALLAVERKAKEDLVLIIDDKAQGAQALADACGVGARQYTDKRWHTAQAAAFRETAHTIRSTLPPTSKAE